MHLNGWLTGAVIMLNSFSLTPTLFRCSDICLCMFVCAVYARCFLGGHMHRHYRPFSSRTRQHFL